MKSIRTLTSLILAIIMTVSLFTVTVGAVGVENTQNTIEYIKYKQGTAAEENQTVINLRKSSATLKVGETCYINHSVDYANGDTEYETENAKIATVDKTGKVTALKEGTVKITVKNNGATAVFTVYVNGGNVTEVTGVTTEPATTATKATTVTEPVAETTATNPTTATEPISQTIIELANTRKTVYVGETFYVPVIITRGEGNTTYTSNRPKVATVDEETGEITAKHRGKARITVTNNGATNTQYVVTVKNPYFTKNGKKVRTVTVIRNHTAKVRLNGKADDIQNVYYNTKSTKYAKVVSDTTNNVIKIKGLKTKKRARLYISVNGVKLGLNVKVREMTPFERLARITAVQKHKVIKRVAKSEPIKIANLVKVKTNFNRLYNQNKISLNQLRVYNKRVKRTVEIDNKKVARLSNNKDSIVIRNAEGKAHITVTVPKKANSTLVTENYDITLKVEKPAETTVNGNKTKICYTYDEMYDELKRQFYDHVIKGEEPEYTYLQATFDKFEEKDYTIEELDTGDNFYNFGWSDNRVGFPGIFDEKNNRYQLKDFTDPELTEYYNETLAFNKTVYKAAQKAFKEMKVDRFTTDYEKLLAWNYWCSYKCDYQIGGDGTGGEHSILVSRTGECWRFAEATTYMCALMKIPCTVIVSDKMNHEWNVVKVQGKWLYFDAKSMGQLTGTLDTRGSLVKYPSKVQSNARILDNITIEEYGFITDEIIQHIYEVMNA